MAGLYDLDLDAQVLDDGAIGWDDPDFSFATASSSGAASASGVAYNPPARVGVSAGLASSTGVAGNAVSALGIGVGIGTGTGTAFLPTPIYLDGGNLVTTGSLVMHL